MTETPSPSDSESELFRRVAHGDAAALPALVASYLPRLRAFVRSRLDPRLRARESASDVVQSACREALEHGMTFEYRGEAEFRGWLFTTAWNKVREKLRYHEQPRRSLLREERIPAAVDSPDEGANTASEVAVFHERAARLEEALDRLDESDRDVVSLTRLAGLPVAEVARQIGKTEAATRKQLGRALLALAAELQKPTPPR